MCGESHREKSKKATERSPRKPQREVQESHREKSKRATERSPRKLQREVQESHREKSKKVSFLNQMHYTLSWRSIMSINISDSQHYYIQVYQDLNISFEKG
jgi:hypothetical protein